MSKSDIAAVRDRVVGILSNWAYAMETDYDNAAAAHTVADAVMVEVDRALRQQEYERLRNALDAASNMYGFACADTSSTAIEREQKWQRVRAARAALDAFVLPALARTPESTDA